MTFLGKMCRLLAVATVAASLGSCSGDSHDSGSTSLRGLIVIPDQSQCPGCTNQNINVVVFGLPTDLSNPVAQTTTNDKGIYDTGDLTEQLRQFDPESDQKSYIVVAVVSTNGRVGGVKSQPLGATASKDFNVTTQIACVASVLLTNDTTECTADPEGKVAPPSDLDDRRIDNLEQAASVVSDQVSLEISGDVACAACSTIGCTEQGDLQVDDAVRSCVATRYAACRPARG